MTIATTSSFVTIDCNGATTVFDYDFIIPSAEDVEVILTNQALVTDQTLDPSVYSVSGIGSESGGSVVYPLSGPAIATGYAITIRRIVPLTQESDFVNQTNFNAEAVETALDNLEMQIQQVADDTARAIKQPYGLDIEFSDFLTEALQAESAAAASAVASAASAAAAAASAIAAATSAATLGRNLAYNSQFAIAQRIGVAGSGSTVADNAYSCDRWRFLGEASQLVYGNNVNGGAGYATSHATIQFSNANNKGGLFQILPFRDVKGLRGATVTFSIGIRVSNVRLGDIRMGVCEWTGTADATTGDPISAWGTTGNPTLSAGWAFLNTPANLSVGAAYVFKTVTVVVGASANNLGLFFWNNDQAYNAADYIDVSAIAFVLGIAASTYAPMNRATDLLQCLEFCTKSFALATVPAQSVGAGTGESLFLNLAIGAAAGASPQFLFPSRMFAAPSMTLYNPAAANAQARNIADGADATGTATASISERGFQIVYTGNAGAALGETFGIHWLASAEI